MTTRLFRSITVGVFLSLSSLVWGCGSGDGSDDPTFVEGTLVDTSGLPLNEYGTFIFETYESSVSDETGNFSINSYKHLESLKMFFQKPDETYTNTVDIGAFPANALSVKAKFVVDTVTNTVSVTSVEFSTVAPERPADPDESPGADETPAPGGGTPPPSGSGPFDANGNTSSFGIPSGLKGNISSGRSIWGGRCASCHAREKSNRSYGAIKASFKLPAMRAIKASNQDIAHLTAYLNRGRR